MRITRVGAHLFSILALLMCMGWRAVTAQTINGQFFTPGLVIVDAPASGNPTTVGSTMPIALDISGDGLLPFPPPSPISSNDLPTAILSLNIFLISGPNNINITVSEGPELLEQEPGSTVKHLDFRVPDCLPAGNYNLTFYEVDRINELTFFAIYPVSVSINRPNDTRGNCTVDNGYAEYQPQHDNRSPIQPFAGPGQANFQLLTSKPTQPTSTSAGRISVVTTALEIVTTVLVPTITRSGSVQVTADFAQETVIVSNVVVPAPAETTINQGSFGVPLLDASAPPRTVFSLLSTCSALGLWFLLANDVL